ncbi:hypothetical protein K1719_007141 [Acacia pycnantha]|nr:hypothetical protein K1719_007141 [Acacia pycnantha]
MGANFSGITSFLLGLLLEIGWNLKLDVVYCIGGYNRCIDANEDLNKEPNKTDEGYPLGIGVRNSLIALGMISVLGFFCIFLVPRTRARSLEEISGENEEQEAS